MPQRLSDVDSTERSDVVVDPVVTLPLVDGAPHPGPAQGGQPVVTQRSALPAGPVPPTPAGVGVLPRSGDAVAPEGTAAVPVAGVIVGPAPKVLVPLEPGGGPWTRLVGEPNLWYDRFHAYLVMGVERTMQATYRAEHLRRHPGQRVPFTTSTWIEISRLWRWKERAEAYDEVERRRTRLAMDEAKRAARERRIALLHGIEAQMQLVLYGKDALVGVKTIEAATLLVRIQGELRAEMDDEPRRRTVHGGDPDHPIGYKVYLVDPRNPASPEDL